MKKNLITMALLTSVSLMAQVGINTPNPQASLDVVSKTATPTKKIVNVQNSNTTNANNLSIYEDSRSYVGKPDNVTPNATTDALVNVYGNASRAPMKLVNPPSTENQVDGASVPGVDYNHLTQVYLDPNGNIVRVYDPYSTMATALNFDGGYAVPGNTTGVKIVDVNPASMIIFKFASGLVLGPSGVGANVHGKIAFGLNSGFTISEFMSGTGSGTNRYNVTATANNNTTNTTSISSYLANVTIAFNTPGATPVDLVFYYQNGAIYARNTGTTGLGIAITESKRYR